MASVPSLPHRDLFNGVIARVLQNIERPVSPDEARHNAIALNLEKAGLSAMVRVREIVAALPAWCLRKSAQRSRAHGAKKKPGPELRPALFDPLPALYSGRCVGHG